MLPAGVILRDAEMQELGPVVDLMAAGTGTAGWGPGAVSAAHRLAFDAVQRDAANRVIVAVHGGIIVGCMQITEIPDIATGHARLHVEHLRVVEEHRGTGIGAALVRWAIQYAGVLECSMVQLASCQQGAEADHFYARLGFVQTRLAFEHRL